MVIAAAITMTFNYTPIVLTAMGRSYLSAYPTAIMVIARMAFGYALFDGRLESFAWAICAATIASAPVLVFQHYRNLNHRFTTMLRALMPSALVSVACMLAAEPLKAVLPSSMPALAMLLVMALPLAAVWYVALRLSHHPMIGEVHQLVSELRARLA